MMNDEWREGNVPDSNVSAVHYFLPFMAVARMATI